MDEKSGGRREDRWRRNPLLRDEIDLPSLVWAANLADLELHTFLHRAPAITRPTVLAFDLDPGSGADIVQCCQVGLWLKSIFDSMELECFPETSGSKGPASSRSSQYRGDV